MLDLLTDFLFHFFAFRVFHVDCRKVFDDFP